MYKKANHFLFLLLVIILSLALGGLSSYFLVKKYHLVGGKLEFRPELIFADGGSYSGDVNEHGVLEGKGRMSWVNGNWYEGEFSAGLFNGHGKYFDITGVIYEGEFVNSLYHGQGVLVMENGNRYEGAFENGLYNGDGAYTFKDGAKYSGVFKEGVLQGEGDFLSEDGDRYRGEFGGFSLEGTGILTDKEGNVYEGEFKYGQFEGKGIYRGKDGEYYEGEFAFGKYSGNGELNYANGDKYKGEFGYGRLNGKGTYWYANPSDGVEKVVGRWRGGTLQEAFEGVTIVSAEEISEYAIYNQLAQLDKAFQKVKEGEPGKIELYSLVVSGYGKEEVFNREVSFIDTMFSDVTGGRSIYLSNSRRDVEAYPMTTRTSIERGLSLLGSKMNDEDILLFYMTSHGSKGEISIQQNGLRLKNLKADDFKAMLDASGIKWKILMLSSCFSGSFVDALEAEDTIIFTSSDKNKKSFGCSDDNEFTYFGKALFKDSLPTESSFEDAFRKASKLISEREEEKGYQHSKPQVRLPRTIRIHIKSWEEANFPLGASQ